MTDTIKPKFSLNGHGLIRHILQCASFTDDAALGHRLHLLSPTVSDDLCPLPMVFTVLGVFAFTEQNLRNELFGTLKSAGMFSSSFAVDWGLQSGCWQYFHTIPLYSTDGAQKTAMYADESLNKEDVVTNKELKSSTVATKQKVIVVWPIATTMPAKAKHACGELPAHFLRFGDQSNKLGFAHFNDVDTRHRYNEFSWWLNASIWLRSWGHVNGTHLTPLFRSVLHVLTQAIKFVDDEKANFYYSRGLRVPRWIPSTATSLASMFSFLRTFNCAAVANWNTTNVTDFSRMFYKATAFSQPIGRWRTQNAVKMDKTFAYCEKFDQSLMNWTTTNVRTMCGLFNRCTIFNSSLAHWKTSNVTNFEGMFAGCSRFNQPLKTWDISSAKITDGMFRDCSQFDQDLSAWQTGNISSSIEMFAGCHQFRQDLSTWDVSNIKFFTSMFAGCPLVLAIPQKWMEAPEERVKLFQAVLPNTFHIN